MSHTRHHELCMHTTYGVWWLLWLCLTVLELCVKVACISICDPTYLQAAEQQQQLQRWRQQQEISRAQAQAQQTKDMLSQGTIALGLL